MLSSDFDYQLPDNKIARHPVSPRRSAKLLHMSNEALNHISFEDLPQALKEHGCDGLWANETKVLQARLYMVKPTGGRLEIFLLESLEGVAEIALSAKGSSKWRCLVRGGMKWTAEIATAEVDGLKLKVRPVDIETGLVKEEGGTFGLNFTWNGEKCFGDVLERLGKTPLPPYMKRESDASDTLEYQTVFANSPGSVAAPTAGLHYDSVLLKDLETAGLPLNTLTLHVGAGTFKPLSDGPINEHIMHSERCIIYKGDLEKLVLQKRRVATGTTTLRTLESLYWMAVIHMRDGSFPDTLPQWTPYEDSVKPFTATSYTEAIQYLIDHAPLDEAWSFSTSIMIRPGYKILSITALITNFHQPGSTLLCLVSACIDTSESTMTWRKLYLEALESDYRFLSYGDGCLLELS
jgi:S-adenosylmethionine:tRNA ribosyltransferase-isomerase